MQKTISAISVRVARPHSATAWSYVRTGVWREITWSSTHAHQKEEDPTRKLYFPKDTFYNTAVSTVNRSGSAVSKMECLIGIKCDTFTILAHDNSAGRSILAMKQDQDKLFKLGDKLGMVTCGEAGDTVYFGEYIQKNIALYRMRNGYSLSPNAAANFTRSELAEFLRKHPYLVNLLMGGYDPETSKSALYFMDYLGTLAEVPYGSHGYGSYFVLGILDRYHRPDMSQEEGEELLIKCIKEVQQRFFINLPSFSYYVIDEKGFSDKKTLTVPPLGEGLRPEAATLEAMTS